MRSANAILQNSCNSWKLCKSYQTRVALRRSDLYQAINWQACGTGFRALSAIETGLGVSANLDWTQQRNEPHRRLLGVKTGQRVELLQCPRLEVGSVIAADGRRPCFARGYIWG